MELILKTDNENNIAKIIALARELNVVVERSDKTSGNKNDKEKLKKRIMNFKAKGQSSFCDTAEWERNEREDRGCSTRLAKSN